MATLEDFNYRLRSQDTLLKKKQVIEKYCFPDRLFWTAKTISDLIPAEKSEFSYFSQHSVVL